VSLIFVHANRWKMWKAKTIRCGSTREARHAGRPENIFPARLLWASVWPIKQLDLAALFQKGPIVRNCSCAFRSSRRCQQPQLRWASCRRRPSSAVWISEPRAGVNSTGLRSERCSVARYKCSIGQVRVKRLQWDAVRMRISH
jgi:hypothetical protein